MKPVFSVVPLDPPIERKGKLYHWACHNRITGRIWKQTYRITRDGAESICGTLNINVEVALEMAAENQMRRDLENWSPTTAH